MQIDERAVKFHTMANTLVAEQKFNEAIGNYMKAIELAPNYDAAIYHLAEAYEAKQLEDQAYKFYLRAIEVNPSYATIHIEAGLDSLLSGPLGKAVAEYKKKMKSGDGGAHPGEPGAHHSAAPAPLGKKGIAPKKLIIDGPDAVSSAVASCDTVSVKVLGERDIPVLEAQVSFSVVMEDRRMDDMAVGPTKDLVYTTPRQGMTAQTDENGAATIWFKRSKYVGRNVLAISVPGVQERRIVDTTYATLAADVEIQPKEKTYSAGSEVTFTVDVRDPHGNPVGDTDVQLTLLERDGADWIIIDAAVEKSDASGVAKHKFKFPTRSGAECRLQVTKKETKISKRIEFRLMSGMVGSAVFIPMKGKVEAGKDFTLKAKLLDSFDNPVTRKTASITIQESSGGEWMLGAANSELTGDDGSIYLNVTPPAAPGAKAVFTIKCEGLARQNITPAEFETVAAGKSDVARAKPAAPAKPELAPLGELSKIGVDVSTDGHKTEVTSDFMDSILPKPSKPVEAPKGLGLDAIDFDHDGSPFEGKTGLAMESMKGAPVAPAASAVGGSGSAFDALDAMLAGEAGGAVAAPPQHAAPSRDEAAAAGSSLMLPDDFTSPESELATPAAAQPDSASAVSDVVLERDNITCTVGEAVQLSITALDQKGQPITSGLSASFKITGETEPDSDVCFILPDETPCDKKYRVESDGSKQLSATLIAPTTIGQVDVDVKCAGVTKKIVLNVKPGSPDKIELSAPETLLPPNGVIAVTARLTDKYGNPLKNETVTFIIKDKKGHGGDFEEPTMLETDSRGEVQATYISNGNAGDRTELTAAHDLVPATAVKTVTIETAEPVETEPEPEYPDEQERMALPDSAFMPADAMAAAEPPPLAPGFGDESAPAFGAEPGFGAAHEPAFGDAFGGPAAAPPLAPAFAPPAAPQQPAFAPPPPAAPQQAFAPPPQQPQQFAQPQPPRQFAPPAPQQMPQQQFAAPPPQQQWQQQQQQAYPPQQQAYPQQPQQQFQSPFQQAAPQPGGGIQYMQDETQMPHATQQAMDNYYGTGAGMPGFDQVSDLADAALQEQAIEEYAGLEDPYTAPKFEIRRGKKPTMEMDVLLPKILAVFGIVVGVVLLVAGSYMGYNYFTYTSAKTKADNLYTQDRKQEAIKYYEKCISLRTKEIDPYLKLAEIYYEFSETAGTRKQDAQRESYLKKAAENYGNVIQNAPNNVDAHFGLCKVYFYQKNYKKSVDECTAALRADPSYGAASDMRKSAKQLLDSGGK